MASKVTNVIHLTNSCQKSQYLISIAKRHTKDHFKLHFVCFGNRGGLNDKLDELGITNEIIKCSNIKLSFKTILQLIKLLKKYKIDIIHAHTFWPSILAVFLGKFLRKKIIVTRHHALHHPSKPKTLYKWIDSFVAKNVNQTIAVSNFIKKILINRENVPENKITTIHNAIDPLKVSTDFDKNKLKDLLNISDKQRILLTISRVHPEKNLDLLFQTMLSEELNNCVLLVVGECSEPYYASIKNAINNTNVIFLGYREDIAELLSISDLLIQPSFIESFGFTIVEAMQMKIPIIASAIDAHIEVATRDVARFFDPYSKEDLLYKILESLGSDKENKAMVDKGYVRYNEYFTFDRLIKSYEEIYKKYAKI